MSLLISEKRKSLWKELIYKNFVTGDVPSYENIESPWYVRLLIGFSGWLAALFMLGFIGAAFEFVFDNKAAGIIVGCIMIFLAYMMLVKKSDSDFSSQFALAVSFAGQVLLFVSLDLFSWFTPGDAFNWVLLGMLQVVLAWFMPSSIHRIWSAFAAVIALNIALAVWHIYFIETSFVMMAVAIVWLNEFKWIDYQQKLKPIGYGLTLAVLYQASTGIFYIMFWNATSRYKESLVQPWVGELLAGMVILYVVWQLLIRQNIKIPGRIANAALIGTLVLIIASLKVFGLTVGVMIVLLGYANGNRILTGLGIASLLYYISAYYYTLQSTLLMKSQMLAILGILLLLASWLIRQMLFANKEVKHAK